MYGRIIEGTGAGRASPVIAAVSRDSRTSWRTRTPRLYLHCTLAGPRRGNLEGKREQCHARSGAYMRISVRSSGNRHLRIVGCCAEAATLAGQAGMVGGERDQRLGVVPRRHWPPLIFPGAFFYLLPSPPPPPTPPLRPLHRIPLVPHHRPSLLLSRSRSSLRLSRPFITLLGHTLRSFLRSYLARTCSLRSFFLP